MWGRVILLVLIAGVVQHFVRLTFLWNTFQKVFNHAPGPCRQVRNVAHGAEDGYLLPNGLLIFSSGFGRPPMGKLQWLDLDSSSSEAEEFRIEGNFDISTFSSHGIGAWEDPKTGEVTLFAVNHHKDGERVEVFLHDGSKTSKTLKHVKTILHPKLPALNDIVATGPNSFYATRFYSLGLEVDFFSMYPGGGVVLYDKGEISVAASGLFMGNGINLSRDRQYLYVVEGMTNVRVYAIQNDKSIREVQVYNAGTSVDNIHVEASSGDLWIGSHPNAYMMAAHLMHLSDSAFSQVIRLRVDDGRIVDLREVYANDGTEIKGSSVAIPYKKKLFIGSVTDRALICDLIYSD